MVMTLDRQAKQKIVDAIRQAERLTSGEVRVHLKNQCGQDVLAEAKKIFHRLNMHKTKQRSAVLILVCPKNRTFAILGDSGIHAKVGGPFWNGVRDAMTGHFKKDQFVEGIIAGVLQTGEALKTHFPHTAGDVNQLPDEVTED